MRCGLPFSPIFKVGDCIFLDGRDYEVKTVDQNKAQYYLHCLSDPLDYDNYFWIEYVDGFAEKI